MMFRRRPEPASDRPRRWLIIVAGGAAVALVPWTVSLGLTLPPRYQTLNWDVTWVGFDVALLLGFVAVAVAGLRRSTALGPAALVTATLLCCDAWFDIMTAATDGDRAGSVLGAIGGISVAAVLATLSVRVSRAATLRPASPGTGRSVPTPRPAPPPATDVPAGGSAPAGTG